MFGDNDVFRTPQILPVIGTHTADDQLESILDTNPETVLLADCRGGPDLQKCDVALSVAEARAGRPAGRISIIASAADSSAGLIRVQTLGGKSSRLAAVGWNRGAFCAEFGCPPDSPIAEHARMQVVIAARALGLAAYDSVSPHPEPEAGFMARSMALGFAGYLVDAD